MIGRIQPARAAFSVCVLAGLAITAIAALSPPDAVAFRASAGRAMLETLVAVITLAAVLAAQRRYRESESTADLCLVAGLAVVFVLGLVFNAAPVVLELGERGRHDLGAVPGQLLAAGLIAAAAFASRRPMEPRARRTATASAVLAVIATTGGALAFLGAHLDPEPMAKVPANLLVALRDAPVTGLSACVVATLFVAASAGFWRRGRTSGDGFWTWIALACALEALTRLSAVGLPEGSEQAWVSTHDLLHVAAAGALAGAVMAELRLVRHRAAAGAVARERRRLARDLHDGVVQDLAFILSQSRAPDGSERHPAGSRDARIVAAAEHALESSRHVVSGLADERTGSIAETIADRAGPLASRWGMTLHVDVDRHVSLRAGELDELVSMVSEAISNAARHAGASNVRVDLRPGIHDRARMRITDDGRGFLTTAPAHADGGFGLGGMRERASVLGGEMWLESEPGAGTMIEVALR